MESRGATFVRRRNSLLEARNGPLRSETEEWQSIMEPTPTNDVMASFYRCRRNEGFIDTFYDLFLSKSTEIARKFEKTDFKLQKLMLRQSLLEMLCFDRGIPGSHEEIERLGRSHKELEIAPHMYSMWLDSLCEAVRRHDPEYTEDLELAWRRAMLKSIQKMIEASA